MRSLDQDSVDQWREWGESHRISVLLHNYPGYGKTPGPVTVDRIMADLEILVDFLKKYWEEEQISILGNSIGILHNSKLTFVQKANEGQDVGRQSTSLPKIIVSKKSFLYQLIPAALHARDGSSRFSRVPALIRSIQPISCIN